MMISERLWVDEGPSSSRIWDIVHCATAEQAADAIQKEDCIAVVPTIDMAHDTILAMGYSRYDAEHAVRWRRELDPGDPSTYQLCEPLTYNETTSERRHRA